MIRKATIQVSALFLSLVLCTQAGAQGFTLGGAPPRNDVRSAAGADADPREDVRNPVPEFPPGLFTDGGRYRLNDLAGKVVVLLFYDGSDPRFAATAAHRAAVARLFRDRPVALFGVQATTVDQARADARRLDLPMPVFADTLGVLALRYRATLAPPKSWHVVIIDPRGNVRHEDMLPGVIESALKTAEWTYRDPQVAVDAKVAAAIDALECGDYDAASRQLNAVVNGMDPNAAAVARQLLSELRTPALAWKGQADRQASTSPIAAYDLYARAALFLTACDDAKAMADAMKRLQANPAVRSELAARVMLDRLCAAISRDERVQKWDAVDYCDEIIRAHPTTSVSESLVAYLDDLGGAKARPGTGVPIRRKRD